jgi:hypothetical protein
VAPHPNAIEQLRVQKQQQSRPDVVNHGIVSLSGGHAQSKHGRRRKGSGRRDNRFLVAYASRSAKLFGSLTATGHCRSGQLVISCGCIQQGLPQSLRRDNPCQCAEAARFLAVPYGGVGQSGGVPIGHDFLPETQSTEHGGGNSAEAEYVEQGFPESRHVCQPPSWALPRTMEIIGARQKGAYCGLGTESNQSWRHGRWRMGSRDPAQRKPRRRRWG